MKGFLSVDVDVSGLEINQCDSGPEPGGPNEITELKGTHKCHNDTSQVRVNGDDRCCSDVAT